MKTRYKFILSLLLVGMTIFVVLYSSDDMNIYLREALMFAMLACVFAATVLFCDMIDELKDMDKKLKEAEKKIEKLTDATIDLKLTQDMIRCKLDEVEDESRRAF